MRNRLLLQRFTPLCASAQTVLVVEPQAGECALFDPLPDAALLDGIEDTIRLNRLSLSWVLFTAGSVDGFRAGQQLQRGMVATRLGIGTLAQRAMHNCAAATGAQDRLPERLFETAYAIACDVAAADGTLREPELRLLEEIRYELNIDRLHAAAIERGARARHMTV